MKKMGSLQNILLIIIGSFFLVALEVLEEPELTLGEIILEMIQPTLIVIIAVGMVRLTEQFKMIDQNSVTCTVSKPL